MQADPVTQTTNWRTRTVQKIRYWLGTGLLLLAWLIGMLAARVMGESNIDG